MKRRCALEFKTLNEAQLKEIRLESLVIYFPFNRLNVDVGILVRGKAEGVEQRKEWIYKLMIYLIRFYQVGFAESSTYERLMAFRYFIKFSDKEELNALDNEDGLIAGAFAYKADLENRIRTNRLKRNTAGSYLSSLQSCLAEIVSDDAVDRLRNLRISKRMRETTSTVPPDKDDLINQLNVSIRILEKLTGFLVNLESFPIHFPVYDKKFICIPNYHVPWVNCKNGPLAKTNAQFIWDYENGKIRSLEDSLRAAKQKGWHGRTYRIAALRRSILARLEDANSDRFHITRLKLAELGAQAFAMIFLAGTGMNLTQMSQIPYEVDELDINPSSIDFKLIKARGGGREVNFEIRKGLIKRLKKYLKLREYIIDAYGIPDPGILFFEIEKGQAYKITSVKLFTYGKKLAKFFELKSSLGSRNFRVFKGQSVAMKHGMFIASQILQNSQGTLNASYLTGNENKSAREITGFFEEYLKGQIAKPESSLQATSLGRCRSPSSPDQISENVKLSPDCAKYSGCLNCKNFAIHSDRKDLRKLLSYSFVVSEFFGSEKNKSPELRDFIFSRIDQLVSTIVSSGRVTPTDVRELKSEIETENSLSPFWKMKYEQFIDLGMV